MTNNEVLSPFDQFIEDLREGDFDARLDELSEALTKRWRVREVVEQAKLSTGDRVMVSFDSNPEYMRGELGHVVGFTKSGKPRVDFPNAPRKPGVWTYSASSLRRA